MFIIIISSLFYSIVEIQPVFLINVRHIIKIRHYKFGVLIIALSLSYIKATMYGI